MSGATYGPLARCAEIAARQHGIISVQQAIASGLSRDAIKRLVAGGSWRRIRPSVLQLWSPADAQEVWRQRLAAAALWLGDPACVSHRAAGALRELDGVKGPPLEFITTGRRRAAEPGLVIHRLNLDPCDIEMHQNLRVTTVARTLVDISSVSASGVVELALESALRSRLVTLDEVRAALERSGRSHKGRGVLRYLLDEHPGRPAESALEVRVWRILLESGLPVPIRQHEVRHRGRLVARVDFAYPHAKLAIEADGYRFHASAPDWRRDRVRQNALAKLGWIVYHATWDDTLRGGVCIIADVSALLERAVTNIGR